MQRPMHCLYGLRQEVGGHLRARQDSSIDAELPVDLWEYLQPYVAEEPAPSFEWTVHRDEPVAAEDGKRRTRVAPRTALA